MKTTLLSLAISALLLVPQVGTAQGLRGGDILFGGSAGTSGSEFRGGAYNTDFKWGGMAGVLVGWRPSRSSVLGLEANWVQKGGQTGDNAVKVDYIELPFTAGVAGQLGGGEWTGRFYTGIGVGFRISCNSELVGVNCDNANSTEWTWPIGFQFGRWSPSRTMIGFDARYSLGMSRIFDNVPGQNYAWQFRFVVGKAKFRR